MDWFMKSMIAMFLMTPFAIITNALGRNGVKPEAMIFYFLLATSVGVGAWIIYTGQAQALKIDKSLVLIICLGLFCGAPANVLLIQSVVECFNPGLPVAIVGTNSLVIFLITPLLAIGIPRYFQHVEFNWVSLLGIVFTVVGIALISINK